MSREPNIKFRCLMCSKDFVKSRENVTITLEKDADGDTAICATSKCPKCGRIVEAWI